VNTTKKKTYMRKRRHLRLRKKVFGTRERPRLSVYKSLNQIYAQIIDDLKGVTLLSVSSLSPEIKDKLKGKNKTEKSKAVGDLLAKKALEGGIKKVIFDRGGFKYHGRIKTLAEAARKAGLKF